MPEEAHKGTDWKSIQFSVKDVVAIIIFLLTASGLYYKVFYEQANANKLQDLRQQQNNAAHEAFNIRITVLEKAIQQLEELNLRQEERNKLMDEYQKLKNSK